jgi:2-oxo-4-hydroxy-4-carboxy-5-ureidoimidazoline decarboxylase
MTPPLTLERLSSADRDSFVAALGGVFEHSPWIAGKAWEARPFASADALHQAMVNVVSAAPRERQLALIAAHPELAGKEAAAGTLTADSQGEQASAGLNRCTAAELKRLHELNAAYRKKFGFPFVMAIKNRSKQEILQALEARLEVAPESEFSRCLDEIARIARLRIGALLEGT